MPTLAANLQLRLTQISNLRSRRTNRLPIQNPSANRLKFFRAWRLGRLRKNHRRTQLRESCVRTLTREPAQENKRLPGMLKPLPQQPSPHPRKNRLRRALPTYGSDGFNGKIVLTKPRRELPH